MAEIVLKGLTKTFADGTKAVDDLNLTIADKEFIILVGPSGCGKSTTLNMIAGLEDISSGDLVIGGERVNDKAPRDRDIAMVFQSYALYPHMTVRENIGFPLKLAKMDKKEMAEKVEHAARVLEIEALLDRKPANLSGGQRQRVAMGRAIVRDPQAFLMDEPLSNLDAKLRVQMRTTIARLQKSLGTTMVYVTHDQTEAMTLGDRIVLMRKGIVQQVGTPEEMYDRPVNLFVAGFIGSPGMNFLPARVTDGGLDCLLGTIPLDERMRRGLAAHGNPADVILGIRPEAFGDAALDGVDGALRYRGTAELVESLGAEKLAYLSLGDAGSVESDHLAEALGNETGGQVQLIAHLSPKSRARAGRELELAYDAGMIHLFEPDSGANMTISGPADGSDGGSTSPTPPLSGS